MDRRWQIKFWVLIALLIGLAGALAVVFVRTIDSARSVEAWNHEYATWHATQLEAEFWRMVEAADRWATGDGTIDADAYQERLDVMSSRLAVFDGGLARTRLDQIAGAAAAMATVRKSWAEVEPGLAALKAGDRAAYAPLRAALGAIGQPLKDLAIGYEHFEVKGSIDEVQGLRDEFQLGAALIGALVVIGIVLVAFLVLEIGARHRLIEAMRASQEQARAAREREEAALIESGRRFLAIARANPVAVLVADDRDGAIRYVNPAAIELLALPEGGTAGLRLQDLFPEQAALDPVVAAGRQGHAERHELQLHRRDGAEVPVELSARALDYDGTPCLVFVLLDLTEKKSAAAEIERQRELIYHREKLGALGSLLAGVAHELNNPLSVVVAQATLLEELATDPGMAARGTRVRAAAERCSRIVKTFLAMARQRPPTRAAIDVNAAVEAALELLGYGLRTAGIEVERALAPQLPPVWGDPDQIGQVLTNLIVNAQQAMADWTGPRRLSFATRLDEAAGMVELRAIDSGPGVPDPIKPRIFEPFFTTKPVGVGTGLGLSVCHGIVASHGGTIAVDDAPGGGTAFTVRLPIGAAQEAEAPAPRAATPRRGDGQILIVDDEPEVAQALADILEGAGFRIDIVDGGAAALEAVRTQDYALVMSDLRMPGMSGIDLYRRLAEIRPELAERFVAITGDTLSTSVQTFLEESRRPCIEKPFVPSEVREMVAVCLAGQTPEQDQTRARLVELSRDLGETVDYAAIRGDRLVFIDQIAGSQRLRAVSAVGEVFPLSCTANGKAYLAQLTDEGVAQLVGTSYEARTPHTITALPALLAELARVRRAGYAVDREEHTLGICAVGVALRDRFGHPVAISVPMPTMRFQGREEAIAERLLRARRELEADFAAPPAGAAEPEITALSA
ncbi:MAG: IclR family transcriptional regulator C-terminal domain-containing protein [Dongiaceae bacterium]